MSENVKLTSAEIDRFILENHKEKTQHEMAVAVNRSIAAISNRSIRLGVSCKKPAKKSYMGLDLAKFIYNNPELTTKEIAKMYSIPNKTIDRVKKAMSSGITFEEWKAKSTRSITQGSKHMTREQIIALKCSVNTKKGLFKKFGHTWDFKSERDKRYERNEKFIKANHHKYTLSELAKETGLSRVSARNILVSNGLKAKPAKQVSKMTGLRSKAKPENEKRKDQLKANPDRLLITKERNGMLEIPVGIRNISIEVKENTPMDVIMARVERARQIYQFKL